MFRLLRALGLLNAAVWFGSGVFFTFAVGPAVFSPEVAVFLPRPQAGHLALIIIDRYFALQYVCAAIALVHLVAEWLISGRPHPRGRFILAGSLLVVALVGGQKLQPQMKGLHGQAYDPATPPAEAAAALATFRKLHGLSQAANLALLGGLVAHLLLIPATPRRWAGGPGPSPRSRPSI